MRWERIAAALALLVVSCGGSSAPAASKSAPAATSAAQPTAAPQAATSQLPKSCNERVSAADVSAAVGKPVMLFKEDLEGGVLCLYDSQSATPSILGFAARISYMGLDKAPTQTDVDNFINTAAAQLKGKATIEHMTGVGDYSGWMVITLTDVQVTTWSLVATKGKTYVEFTTWSGVTQGDKGKMSAVVNKALG
jgi:hypothetical protein